MAKWMAVFAFCSVTVFAQSTLSSTSLEAGRHVLSGPAARKQGSQFNSIRLVRIDDGSDGWARAHKTHIADVGAVDQIHGN